MTPTHRSTARALVLSTALALAAMLPASTAAQSPAAAGALDGTWTIDHTIGSFDYDAGDFSGSWVGYRAQEELVGVGGAEAVGRTPAVDGTITLAGTQVTAAELTADLTTLRSNEPMRDGQLGRQGVQTDRFPTATFLLTQPIDLGTIPAEGTPITVDAVGDLTIHGVTRNVTIPLAAVQQGHIIGAAGSLTFTWGDFGMTQPTSMRVVSLADDVTLELQVFLRHDATAVASPLVSPAA
jgi:polyisoprenoid-binding protein YceI